MKRIKLNTYISASINSKPTQPTAEEEYLYHQNRQNILVSFRIEKVPKAIRERIKAISR